MVRIKRIKRGDRRHIRVQQVWTVLVSLATAHRLGWSEKDAIPYGELAVAMGYDARAGLTLANHLGTIAKLCINNQFPCLNALVVQADGAPGSGTMHYEDQSPSEAKRAALRFDWLGVRIPSPSAFRKTWDSWEDEYVTPPKPMKQIDMLRKLFAMYPDDDERIIEEYAKAERSGRVFRKSNDHGLSPEEYGRMYLRRARSRGQI